MLTAAAAAAATLAPDASRNLRHPAGAAQFHQVEERAVFRPNSGVAHHPVHLYCKGLGRRAGPREGGGGWAEWPRKMHFRPCKFLPRQQSIEAVFQRAGVYHSLFLAHALYRFCSTSQSCEKVVGGERSGPRNNKGEGFERAAG